MNAYASIKKHLLSLIPEKKTSPIFYLIGDVSSYYMKIAKGMIDEYDFTYQGPFNDFLIDRLFKLFSQNTYSIVILDGTGYNYNTFQFLLEFFFISLFIKTEKIFLLNFAGSSRYKLYVYQISTYFGIKIHTDINELYLFLEHAKGDKHD